MDKFGGEILGKTQGIFTLPADQVCGALDRLVEDSHAQELLHTLEHIIDTVFGANSKWDLRLITSRSDGVTYKFLNNLLEPNGPVFRLIYKLVSYWDSKTVYNLTECMVWVRDLFEEGMPEYFMDKVSVDDRTRKIMHMSLNAFELYMMNFAYYVVNPWLQKPFDSGYRIHDSIYMRLLTVYLTTFVPCDTHEVLPYVRISYTSLRSTLPRHQQASYRPDPKPCIFRQSLFHNVTDTTQQPYKHDASVWRSEAVIYILSYVWLVYGKQDTATGNIVREPPPSMDHVRVVRTMIKHFHFFANSAVGDMSAMDSLKRIVRPLCADKIYRFLRRAIYNWPLDISFRIILEAWLSYVQPWRYTDYSQFGLLMDPSQPETSRERRVERLWQNFIAENLFCYTIIYQQILPRFYRLDLTTPMNSMIVQRVLKVFSQKNLNLLIAEVEACLGDHVKSERDPASPKPSSSMDLCKDNTPVAAVAENSPLVLTMGKHWQAILNQKLLHLEGPRYKYTPMFENSNEEARKLIDILMPAYIQSYVAWRAAQDDFQVSPGSCLSVLKSWFVGIDDAYHTPLSEQCRVVNYLKQALGYVSDIYNIPNPTIREDSRLEALSLSSSNASKVPTVSKVSASRWVLHLAKDKTRPTKAPPYEGDPDTMPIMTTESIICVRMLHRLATMINNKYSAEIKQLFERPGFVGRLVRQFISPPRTIRIYSKQRIGQLYPELIEKYLPPRLSFRWMGSYKFLFFVVLLLAISHIFYDNLITVPFTVFGLWFIFIVVKALLEPLMPEVQPQVEEPTQEMNEIFDLDVSL